MGFLLTLLLWAGVSVIGELLRPRPRDASASSLDDFDFPTAEEGRPIQVILGGTVKIDGANVVYTDAWTSMGQEAEAEERRDAFAAYRVDDELMAAAGQGAVAMHCLPAHRGEEIASSVMDGPQSLIFEQSENRLHVQKALLVELLG